MTDARPRKRSLTLHGHRTSVSLEDAFWYEFQLMAADRGVSVNALAARIDRDRGVSAGLASAIRIAVLRHVKAKARVGLDGERPPP
ncbi:ribbon-helix-helix domain-containing protein [Jannaschia sp. LMIT008]|uniref:ribbon-helix-helix domain-containing protein n=1 Tax=Jannaschia maritima TaxID=3032585 RepID=UPI002810AD6D|nr:ribbon-helix-helix domain-containing protein [Jannaschia sp. LMIT008]